MILDSVLLCFLIVAAIQDYDKAKIANAYIIVMVAVGFGIRIWNQDSFILVLPIINTFSVFFILYLIKVMGAGDVKLITASAVFLGREVWLVTGIALFVAAVWGLFKLVRSHMLMTRIAAGMNYVGQVLGNKKLCSYSYGIRSGQEITVPFAVCLCVGYIGLYMYRMLQRGGAV